MPGLGSAGGGGGCCLSQRRGMPVGRGAGRGGAGSGVARLLPRQAVPRVRVPARLLSSRSFAVAAAEPVVRSACCSMRNCRTASASTLRMASSSARRSRVMSVSLSAGVTLRNCSPAHCARAHRAHAAFAGALFEPSDGARDQWIVVGHQKRTAQDSSSTLLERVLHQDCVFSFGTGR